ncbi:MAG: hypothetical protein HYR96_09760 [Deltaproteobacteria bacterium]|nr:hypothetical protein [Deltaproteobacteria bacterium]
MKFNYWLLIVSVLSLTAPADIRLVDGSDRAYRIYEANGEVHLARCTSGLRKNDSCRDELQHISVLDFSGNLNALFGIPSGYGGQEGLEALLISIQELEEEIAEAAHDQTSIEKLRTQIKKLAPVQRKLMRLHQLVYSALESQKDTVITPVERCSN